MRRQVDMILRIASAVLVFSGYLALASVRLYGPGLLLIPLVALPLAPIGTILEKKSHLWRIARRGVAIGYIGFLPFSLQLFGLMDAVILLVIFIQLYLLLGDKTARIYYEIYLMAFFLLLAAVSQSPESMIAIALILFATSTVWAFAVLRMHVELQENPARSSPELVALRRSNLHPKTGNLFDFGLFLSMTAISFISLLLTVVLFILTPRVEAGWLGRRDAQQSVTGISDSVRLMGSTTITEDTSVVMHVRFPDEDEERFVPENDLYFRITTLPRFSEDSWSRRGLQEHYEPKVPGPLGNVSKGGLPFALPEARRLQRDQARTVRQIIYMDSVPEEGVPCLDLPRSVRLLSESPYSRVSWDPGEDFTLVFETRGARTLQYECFSTIPEYDPQELRNTPLDYSFMPSRDYSLLTYHQLLPETQELAGFITESHPSAYEKVRALESWLGSPEFSYTLNVPALPAANGIDAFISTIKNGHCELYASALALMVRSLGIPARVVSGYRGAEYSETDNAYLVRGAMAHLWVEALFKDVGWVRFDPSPRSDLPTTGLGRVRMAWSSYVLRAKMFWFQQVEGFQGSIRLDGLMRLRPWSWRPRFGALPHFSLPEPSEREGKSFTYWTVLEHPASRAVAFLLVIGGMFFLWKRWKSIRLPRLGLTSDQVRVRKLYLRFLRKVAAMDVDCSNKSAHEIEEALRIVSLAEPQSVTDFIQTYNQVRFGGRPLNKTLYRKAAGQVRSLRRLKAGGIDGGG